MRLSIITINYNNAEGLQKTIQSVVNQSYRCFEHIIIDGGSNDGSKELIEQHSHGLSYWVSEPDNGIYHAMNKGILKAQGEYLLFLNSGDYLLHTDSLTFLIENSNGFDIVYGNVVHDISQRKFIFGENLDFLFFIRGSIGHGASIISRELFKLYGLYNESYKIVSDWEFFFINIVKNNVSYCYVDEIITVYQLGGVSTNKQFAQLQKAERDRVVAEQFPMFLSLIDEMDKNQKLLTNYLNGSIFSRIFKLLYFRLFIKTND